MSEYDDLVGKLKGSRPGLETTLAMREAAKVIRELEAKLAEREWVSVEDRLPEGKVLICFGEPFFGDITHETEAGYYDEESNRWLFWLSDREVKGAGVTHWQPLPTPPTMDK